jgi:hypothetical protein
MLANTNVIGTHSTYTDPSTILPGQSAPFRFYISDSDVTNLNSINSYKLIVSGQYLIKSNIQKMILFKDKFFSLYGIFYWKVWQILFSHSLIK